ncbi:MAG: hypothetical protein ABI980_04135 [Nitrospirota bacterium]
MVGLIKFPPHKTHISSDAGVKLTKLKRLTSERSGNSEETRPVRIRQQLAPRDEGYVTTTYHCLDCGKAIERPYERYAT